MQTIMEVEDMIVNETTGGKDDRTNYFTAENEELKGPMPPFMQAEESKDSILKNTPGSNDMPNYLENVAGNSSQDPNRYSNVINGIMHKSYTQRKESGVTTQDGGKPGSSSNGHLENIAEENQNESP